MWQGCRTGFLTNICACNAYAGLYVHMLGSSSKDQVDLNSIQQTLSTSAVPYAVYSVVQDDDPEEQMLIVVNGTIQLTGAIRISGENSSLFSECFVLHPSLYGKQCIRHQIFKVHKPQGDQDSNHVQAPPL